MAPRSKDVTPRKAAIWLAERIISHVHFKQVRFAGIPVRMGSVSVKGDSNTVMLFQEEKKAEIARQLVRALAGGEAVECRGFGYWLDFGPEYDPESTESGGMRWNRHGQKVRSYVKLTIRKGKRVKSVILGHYWGNP